MHTQADALLDALGDTLGEIKADIFFARQWLMWRTKKTMYYSLIEVRAQTPPNTLRDMEAKASGNTLADRVAEVKVDKVGETLTDVIGASPD